MAYSRIPGPTNGMDGLLTGLNQGGELPGAHEAELGRDRR